MKTEPGLAGVKTELGLDDAVAMKWAREDWARLELERQSRAIVEIATRCRGRDEEASSFSMTVTATHRRRSAIATPNRGPAVASV